MRDFLHRIRGLTGFSGQLVYQRLRHTAPRRTTAAILGVAFAVALCLTVSGVSVAVASQGSIVSSNVDYWVVPETESSTTLPVSVGGPAFGDVHRVANRLTQHRDIAYASPVSIKLLQLTHNATTEYVLVAGVIAHPELTIAGVSARPLTSGDPHFANGTYTGPWTDELVLSTAASDLLNASANDTVTFGNLAAGQRQRSTAARNFTVTAVTEGGESGLGTIPIGVMHLAELQSLTGGTTSDTADQILVATTSPRVRDDLTGLYPQSRVITRGTGLTSVTNSKLALALAVAGLIVSLVVGVLFVATTLGLEVTTDRRLWATLTAVGFSTYSRAFVLFLQTLFITLCGGVLGIVLGRVGVFAANFAIGSIFEQTVVAVFPPEFIGYAVGLAAGIAILTTPYVLWLTTRGRVTKTLAS